MRTTARWVLSVVVVVLVLIASPLGAQPRGYQSRPSGWDLDFDGILGESSGADVAICDGTGGTNEDIDGNGVADRQVYVDLTSGSDTATCGAPASPCRTLRYAMDGSNTAFADRIQAPATNQIQAVCFKGTANVTVGWTRDGSTGTYTRAASGNQVRSFQYPRYPFILSGWDADGDNQYPPHDPGDVSVVDGNLGFDTAHFIQDVPHSRVEVAHFTVRDYGRACPATGSGVTYFATGGHVYYHDLDLIDNNRACTGTNASGTIQFDNFVGGSIIYAAIQNVRASNFGGYFWRGSTGAGSGPYRLQNITAATLAATGSLAVHLKPWGEIDGIEVLDSIWDLNPAGWEEADVGGVTAVAFAQCVRDVDFVNNEIIDFRVGITIQPSASGACSSRNMDAITIDRNIIRNRTSTWGPFGHIGIQLSMPETSDLPTIEDVDITNNFISSTNSNWRSGILSHVSHGLSQPGTIRIAHNTIQGTSSSFDLGAIGVCSNTACLAVKQDNYVIYNNIIGGGAAGGKNIRIVGYQPAGWNASGNIYQASMDFEWNIASYSMLSAYQTACQGGLRTCDPTSTESCLPSFVGSLTGDFHLLLGDVCAIDRGVALSAITSVDLDKHARPQGIGWDIGADEFLPGILSPLPPTNLKIIP